MFIFWPRHVSFAGYGTRNGRGCANRCGPMLNGDVSARVNRMRKTIDLNLNCDIGIVMKSEGQLSKKELRKKLEQDEVAVLFETLQKRSIELWTEHGRTVVLSVVVIVCAALIGWAYKAKNAYDFVAQQGLLSEALQELQLAQRNAPQGLPADENYENAIRTLDELLANHGSSSIGATANLLRGYCALQTGSAEEARGYLERGVAKVSDPSLKALYTFALVQTGSTGGASDGVTQLRTLRESLKDGLMKVMATFFLARVEERAGNEKVALELYQSIPADSSWNMMAERYVRWLETEPLPPLNPKS